MATYKATFNKEFHATMDRMGNWTWVDNNGNPIVYEAPAEDKAFEELDPYLKEEFLASYIKNMYWNKSEPNFYKIRPMFRNINEAFRWWYRENIIAPQYQLC